MSLAKTAQPIEMPFMGAGTWAAEWATAHPGKIRVGHAHPGNINRGLKTFRQ